MEVRNHGKILMVIIEYSYFEWLTCLFFFIVNSYLLAL